MNNQDLIKLDDQMCFSLYAASREVIRLYKPILDEFGLTYTQYMAMIVLWEEDKITVKKMGQRLHLDSGTLTPLLKKLEKMDLITRYRDEQDNRIVFAQLTSSGRDLQSKMRTVPKQIACQVKISMSEAQVLKKQLDELLKTFES
ncbi:MAG: MarR family winged helix-turn-helix transcriptional regulator [Turicibacter sp.]